MLVGRAAGGVASIPIPARLEPETQKHKAAVVEKLQTTVYFAHITITSLKLYKLCTRNRGYQECLPKQHKV